ncbi:MAG TPA: acyl-CoA dehydrogenase, partial [Mycobacterium sp.]
LGAGRGTAQERVALSAEVEAAMAAVESLARSMPAVTQQDVEDQLTRALCVRYAVEGAVARASMAAAALLGGMAFIQSSDVAYLLAASRALSLHPPAMAAVSDSVDRYLRGGRFNV